MNWGKAVIPDGVREFDVAYFWRFAWLPMWDNVAYEWFWLERRAIRFYWSNMELGWRRTWNAYDSTYHRVVLDCREVQGA